MPADSDGRRSRRRRREVVMLGRAVALAVLAAFLAEPAVAQVVDGPKVAWKMGAWGKRRAATEGIELAKKHVEERTGGKFTITIGYETFGSPKELLDLIKVNAIDASVICSSYHPEKLPASTVLDLPFLPLDSFDRQARTTEAMFRQPAILQELAAWNAQPYLSSVLPQYEFMGRGRAPRTIDDFKGMRVRAIGGLGDAMRKLGAVPTSMDATEVYTALERGTVDAASFPSSYAHAAYKLHDVSKWLTTNLSPGTVSCPAVINSTSWAKLPPEYRKLLEEAKPQAYAALKEAYKSADDRNFPEFRKKGIALVRFSDDELKQFRKVGAEPVWQEWVDKREQQGLPGRQLFDALLEAAAAAGRS
jgi:TRAP-type C4-dicarboxylate transport system substrate-binding protein